MLKILHDRKQPSPGWGRWREAPDEGEIGECTVCCIAPPRLRDRGKRIRRKRGFEGENRKSHRKISRDESRSCFRLCFSVYFSGVASTVLRLNAQSHGGAVIVVGEAGCVTADVARNLLRVVRGAGGEIAAQPVALRVVLQNAVAD